MILALMATPFMVLVNSAIGILPSLGTLPDWLMSAIGLLRTATIFFPVDVWLLVLSNVFFWLTVHAIFGIFKFIKAVVPFF